MKTTVKFKNQIQNGEQKSLQEIIEGAFKSCGVIISDYIGVETENGYEVTFNHYHDDIDYFIQCIVSIFEGLNVEVNTETPYDPFLSFIVG